MTTVTRFIEKSGEKDGQRRKRFLQFLRDIPPPSKRFDDKRKVWIADEDTPAS